MMTRDEVRAGMMTIVGDDSDLLDEIYQDYLTAAENVFRDASNAERTGDFEMMRRAAHTLKGCSANIGAEVLRALALDWETAACNSDLERFRVISSELQRTFEKLGLSICS